MANYAETHTRTIFSTRPLFGVVAHSYARTPIDVVGAALLYAVHAMCPHTKDRYYSAGALRPWWPYGTGAYDSELC